MRNKYLNKSHIKERKFRGILMYFSEDEPASQTAKYTKVTRKTSNKIYGKFRVRTAELSFADAREHGELEVDESYFGERRVRG
jgi:hypothetical protein